MVNSRACPAYPGYVPAIFAKKINKKGTFQRFNNPNKKGTIAPQAKTFANSGQGRVRSKIENIENGKFQRNPRINHVP